MRRGKYARIESEIFLLSMEDAPNLVIHFITPSLTHKKRDWFILSTIEFPNVYHKEGELDIGSEIKL